jgi:uncharacterized protein YjdB
MKPLNKIMIAILLIVGNLSVFSQPVLNEDAVHWKSTWINNTLGYGKHLQNFIHMATVQPDGTVYTHSTWDEAGQTDGVYKNKTVIGNVNHNINNKQVTIDGKTWSISGVKVVGPSGKVITDLIKPFSIGAAHHDKNLLYVSDDGAGRHNIRIYNISGASPTLVETFGEPGGVTAGTPGVLTPTKFWAAITGCGTDNTGKRYVIISRNGDADVEDGPRGCAIKCFNPEGDSLLWELISVHFIDNGDFDRTTDGKETFGFFNHTTIDFSKPDYENWKLTGITYDRDRYPNDPRRSMFLGSTKVRHINGVKYLFRTDMYYHGWNIYRFEPEPNDICFPVGSYEPKVGESAGFCIDYDGNIWEATLFNGIYKTPFLGSDANNKPIFGPSEYWPMPDPMTNLERIDYSKEEDAMYLTGYDKDFRIYGKNIHGLQNCGPTMICYDNWSNPEKRKVRWMKHIPYYQHPTDFGIVHEDVTGEDIEAEGDYVFVGYGIKDYSAKYLMEGDSKVNTKYNGTGGWVRVYRKSDGELLGRVIAQANTNYESGWLDNRDAMNVIRRSNGEYLIMTEEGWKARNLLFRWCPTGDCDQECTTQVDSISIEPAKTISGYTIDTLKVQIYPDTACFINTIWSSSNIGIVKVIGDGVLHSVSQGQAWIKAVNTKNPHIQDSCLVTVVDVPVTGIAFNSDSLTLDIGDSARPKVIFTPIDALNRLLTWESADTSIARVDATGKITGIFTGETQIIATSVSGSYHATLKVKVNTVRLKGIEFVSNKIDVWMNDSVQLKVIFNPANSTNKNLVYVSQSPTIVEVTDQGAVKGLSLGSSLIIATSDDGGFIDSCMVTVVPQNELVGMDIGEPCADGTLGRADGTYTLTASGTDIWNNKDEFLFACRKFEGNGQLVARIKTLSNTNPWSKAGVMFRESIDYDSKQTMMVVTPGNGTSLQGRKVTGGASWHVTPLNGEKATYWVKLVRIGNLIYGYSAPDGHAWKKIGRDTCVMNNAIYAGLALTSHAECTIGTAVFDSISFSHVIDTLVNKSPLLTISPSAIINSFLGDTVMFSATASDPDGSVNRIEFRVNDTLIKTSYVAQDIVQYVANRIGQQKLSATVFDNLGAWVTKSVNVKVAFPAALNNEIIEGKIHVFPNPLHNGQIFISGLKGQVTVKIYNLSGQEMFTKKAFSNSVLKIDNLNLENGVYVLQIQSDSEVTTKKIIVQ